MKPMILCVLGVLLPITSAFITYTFVSAHNNPLVLDGTQAALICLALMKVLLLGATGVFPIDMDRLFIRVWGDNPRRRRETGEDVLLDLNHNLFKSPEVETMPCLRRLLCEVETAARTDDNYAPQPSQNMVDRHPEEEVDVELPDPLTELYIEAIRAMYGHDQATSPDSTEATEKALQAVQSLTGDSCERAYRLCPGRYTAPLVFRSVFEEIGYHAKDEL